MQPARAYNSHPSAALLMLRGALSAHAHTWSDLVEFAADLDRMDAEDAWQAELLDAVEAEDER